MRSGVLVVCVLAGCAASLVEPPAPPRQTQMGLAITRATLPNGLHVVLVKDPSARDVQVTMRYAVGDVDDPVGQEGVAHLVEHMMFETKIDTVTRTVFAKLESISTEFNGITSHDATTYVERGAMDKLDSMLGVEMTRLVSPCSTWTQAAFERARAAVANEQRENDQGRNLVGVLERAIFPVGHPYTRAGKTTEVGVASLMLEQACAFADAHYTPGNAALVVAGNLSENDLGEAIDRTLGQLPARAATGTAVKVSQENEPRHLTSSAPLPYSSVMLAWPLPTDPAEQIRVLAVAQRVETWIAARAPGFTFGAALGDARAPMFVVIAPVGHGSSAMVLEQLRVTLGEIVKEMRRESRRTELGFNMLKQSSLARMFRSYEEDSDRDARLAAYALAGGDPAELIGKEVSSLRSMTQAQAADIAEQTFGFAQAIVVELSPTKDIGSKKHVTLAAPARDPGLVRSLPDATQAALPAPAQASDAGRSVIKTLPNGLTVVLLPITSVPTVDIRLVFHSGSADEDRDKRGAALVAANALTLDSAYLDDVATFTEAGGTSSAHVTFDATTFSVSGLDMHVDYLLRGLRRLVMDSRYDETAHTVVASLRAAAKRESDSDDSLSDAWRAAVYGDHPYAMAGVADKASKTLRVADAEAFRTQHYTPDNATLIIAGHFDAALAEQWAEFLFADWRKSEAALDAPSALAMLTPASFVRDAEGELVELRLALPAAHGTLAQRLIAAQMLQSIVDDIRHELSASYGVDASYDEHVSSSTYSVDGRVLASRAADAMTLIRDRLAQLRTDPGAAARAFVDARERVLVELGDNVASAARIAASVESDVTMRRPPLASRKNAEDVRTTTIAAMSDVLGDLDLAKAAILLVGPHESTNDAFAALDRIATPIAKKAELTEEVAAEPPSMSYRRELELERSERNPPGHLGGSALGGAFVGQLLRGDVTGGDASGAALWNFGSLAIGVQLSAGYLSGTYTRMDRGVTTQADLNAIAFGGDLVLQIALHDRVWAAPLVGVHANSIGGRGDRVWRVSPSFGGQLGVDVYKRGADRVSLFARYETEVEPKDSLFVWTFGAGFRR